MSEMLYLKLDINPLVRQERIHIADISETWCRESHILAKCRAVRVPLQPSEKGKSRTIYSSAQLVQLIQEAVEQVEVTVLGEQDIVISYAEEHPVCLWLEWCRTAFISFVIFCGAAFAIMTFNNDVGVQQVFDSLHVWIMGTQPEGFSLLEAGYSVGLAVGILGFYNHFRRKSRLADPTPLEVEMRQYEFDLNTAILREAEREQGHV